MNQEVTAPLQTERHSSFCLKVLMRKPWGSLCFYPLGDCGGEHLLWCWGSHFPQSGLPVEYILLLFVCVPKSFFSFLKYFSHTIHPSLLFSQYTCLTSQSPPDPFLISLQKRAALPGMSTKQGISSYKSKNLSSFQSWKRQPSRRKRFSKTGN